MPVPLNSDQLLDLVEKSNLIPQHKLDKLDAGGAISASTTAKELAALMVEQGLLTNFQSGQLLQGKWRGFSIGKYKVLERLGSGGMGSVYLCEHLRMHHKVAVKVLPTSRSTDPSALGRFYREARAAASIKHPNLVHAHDVDQDNDLHFIVMDYVEGVNLQQLVTRGNEPLSVLRACHYVYQAAQGLGHAHRAGLVHRDVKPANVLLDAQGVIRILDLGLARFFEDNQDVLTLKYDDKSLLGTADYVSPEQAVDSHSVDTRTDVYSLGATFYFLLTGHPPFPDGKVSQKLMWHQAREPEPIQDLRPDVPARVAAILSKMMAKNKARRYQTMEDLAEALEPFVLEPIEPPGVEELPLLSPAARTTGSKTTHGSNPTPAPRPKRPSKQTPVPSAEPGATVISAGKIRTAKQTQEVRRRVSAVQEPLQDLSETPLAQPADTLKVRQPAPVTPVPARAPKPIEAPQPEVNGNSTRKAVLIGIMLIAGGLGGFLLQWHFRGTAGTTDETDAPQSTTWVVSRKPDGDHLKSVRDALSRAKPGDRIEVRDATWNETLHLSKGDNVPSGVVIEGKAPSGEPVVWKKSLNRSDDQPILSLTDVKDLQITGFVFDGENRVDELAHLMGATEGVQLTDVRFTAFRHTGLRLRSVIASPEKPLTIRKARFDAKRPARQGIRIVGAFDRPARHVHVADGRFEGDMETGIVVDGPADDLVVRGNRFFNLVDAVMVAKTTTPSALQVRLVENTFCEIRQSALHFESPPDARHSRVTLEKNLFSHVGRLGRMDNLTLQPPDSRARWIGSDRVDNSDVQHINYFRKEFPLPDTLRRAVLNVACDDAFTVWLNGKQIGRRRWNPQYRIVHAFDVTAELSSGDNVIAIEGEKWDGTFGLLAELRGVDALGREMTIVTDSTWRTTSRRNSNWQSSDFNDDSWSSTREIAQLGEGPRAWRELVWESKLREQLGQQFERAFPAPTGNVRDLLSFESFPGFDAQSTGFRLPTDPEREDFLLYDQGSPLDKLGSPGARR